MPALHELRLCRRRQHWKLILLPSSPRAITANQSCDDLVVTSELILDRELVNYFFSHKGEKKTHLKLLEIKFFLKLSCL